LKKNVNTASWQYNRIGYDDDTYGCGRTVVKLTGMLEDSVFNSLTATQINEVTYYVKEATGSAAAIATLHPIDSTLSENNLWSETSIKWSTLYNDTNTTGYTVEDAVCTLSLGNGQVVGFDITDLAKAWRNGDYYGGKTGFILIGAASEANHIDKAIYSSEYSNSERRPYVVVEYVLADDSFDVKENATRQISTTGFDSGTVIWTSAVPAVATVSSSGLVTAVRAGTTTITATVNNEVQKQVYVRVILDDGVYRIKNSASSYYLSADGAKMTTDGFVYTKAKTSTVPNSLAQMWKIKYLGEGIYSVRPMHKLDLTLSRGLADPTILADGGTDDALSSSRKWKIEYDGSGYIFKNRGESAKALKTASTALNAQVSLVTYISGNTYFRWSLEKETTTYVGVLLYDTDTQLPVTNSTEKSIAVGQTLTPEELGIIPSVYTTYDTSYEFIWSRGTSSYVNINPENGEISALSVGEVTITLVVSFNNDAYTREVSYNLRVLPIREGVHFIENYVTGKLIDIDEQTGNSDPIYQWQFQGDDTQRWRFTHIGDSWYSIESVHFPGYYLSVNNNSTAAGAEIVLNNPEDDVLTSGMKWSIERTTAGTYIFTPQCGANANLVLASDSYSLNLNGISVIQKSYTNDLNRDEEWYIKYYSLTVKPYYDSAFRVRYQTEDVSASRLVTTLLRQADSVFWREIGLQLDIETPSPYESVPDLCKIANYGDVTATSIDSCCPANPIEGGTCSVYNQRHAAYPDCADCTGWGEVFDAFMRGREYENDVVYILFTGHSLYSTQEVDYYGNPQKANRSFHSGNGIVMQDIESNAEEYLRDVLSVVVHEISHDVGAPDHYCEEDPDNPNGPCLNDAYCTDCHPEYGRAEWCLMYSTERTDLLTCDDDTVYCELCYIDIVNHLLDEIEHHGIT